MRHPWIGCTVVLLFVSTLAAQEARSVVRGKVTDGGGRRFAGVTITATNETTRATFTAVTDENGEYRFELPPGRYTFTAELSGFGTRRVRGVAVKGPREFDMSVSGGHGAKALPPPPPPPPPQPAPPPPKGGTTRSVPGTLSWNIWTAAYPGLPYQPVPRLQKDSDYIVILHLSGLPYNMLGVSATPASSDLNGWAEEWLNTGEPSAKLQVLLLPDTNYFSIVDGRVKSLEIDLRAMRDWNKAAPAPVLEPLVEIRRARENGAFPSFVFGEVRLRLHTTSREGVGAVGLSIWSDSGRPVDELTLSFCVSDKAGEAGAAICTGIRPVQQTLKGTDSVRIATEGESAPDAALHFLELDNRGVVGVFRDNTCPDCGYKVWTLGQSGRALRDYLANTALPAFGPTATINSLADAGRGLYNLLFPDDADKERVEARRAFEQFVERELQRVQPTNPARSMFVRTLLTGSAFEQPVYLPLGLVTIPSAPEEFLGFHFRIEAPLERQTYRAPVGCISRWFFAVPPSNEQSSDPLPTARKKFEPLMTAWGPRTQQVFQTIPDFRQWLGDPKPEVSTALVVLSHHNLSTLSFGDNETLTSTEVQRRFGEASMLVLDGCSTGAPMALDLLRKFNEHGIATTIASQVAVRPELAGDFLSKLGEVIDSGDTQGLTIADVFFRTLNELRLKQADDRSLPYGPRALVFSLLGNGATRICSPQKEVP